jgi:hypothetical protein
MYSSILSLASALNGVGWSKLRAGRLKPGEVPVPIVWEAGPVWTGVEDLVIGI